MNTTPDALKLASVPIVDRGIGWQADATATLKAQAAQIAALKETLHNELDGNLRLRDLGGARPDECMTTFLERVFSERDQGRAALADVAMMLKVCAWALRRGTSPTLGERALVLLTKHGLMGSPLRSETLDEAGRSAADLYDRWTGKA